MVLDEIGFVDEVDRTDLQRIFPSGHAVIRPEMLKCKVMSCRYYDGELKMNNAREVVTRFFIYDEIAGFKIIYGNVLIF